MTRTEKELLANRDKQMTQMTLHILRFFINLKKLKQMKKLKILTFVWDFNANILSTFHN